MYDPESDWRRQAACQGATDTMYPEPDDLAGIATAKAVCAACPVRAACRADGLQEEYGVWGGLSEEDRRALRRLARKMNQERQAA